jgi:hypothetical protein
MRPFEFFLLASIVLLVAGCGVLDISDDRIDEIANTTGKVVESTVKTLVTPVADPYVPGGGAAAGSAAGLAVSALVVWVLKQMQKNKVSKIQAIADAVKNGG